MNRYLAFALSVGGAGCSSPSGGTTLGSEEATALAPIKIDLPPPPSFEFPDQPLGYTDGTVSVFGLRKQMDKYLGKDVKVKAYLLEVYQCNKCPKGQTCKSCYQPHFYLSDVANGKKEKALTVVDYLMPKQKPPMLTLGKQYTVDGTFLRRSQNGFGDSDGLLQFTRMSDDKGQEFVSLAQQLQEQALKGEQLEAAAALKAKAPPAKPKPKGPKAELRGSDL